MYCLNILFKIQIIDYGYGEYRGVRVFYIDEVVCVFVLQILVFELYVGFFLERFDVDVGDDFVLFEFYLFYFFKDVNGDCLVDVMICDRIVFNFR